MKMYQKASLYGGANLGGRKGSAQLSIIGPGVNVYGSVWVAFTIYNVLPNHFSVRNITEGILFLMAV